MEKNFCSIESCSKKVFARGWCARHYNLWYTHGSPYISLIAEKGAPERFIEFACAHESDECLIWPYGGVKDSYGQIYDKSSGRVRNAHAVVCEKIYGPAPDGKPESAHKCGVPQCVNKRHVYWASYKENNHDRIKHGTVNRGVRHGNSKLDEHEVREIRNSRGKVKQAVLASRFGVSVTTICEVQKRKNWWWLN